MYGISVRQPVSGDIVGDSLHIAALGTAFEANYLWRLVRDGKTLADGFFMAGSMGVMQTFVTEVSVQGVKKAGAAVFELNGEWPADDEEAPAPEPVRVNVIVIPGAMGYVPYQVRKGDTLTAIVKEVGSGGPVSTVRNAALASGLKDPNRIRPGQILRIPV